MSKRFLTGASFAGNVTISNDSTLLIPSHSGFEIDVTGSHAANFRSNAQMFLLSQTGAIHLGTNGVNSRMTISASGDTTFTGVVTAPEFSANVNNTAALRMKSTTSTIGYGVTSSNVISWSLGGVHPSGYFFRTTGANPALEIAANGDATFSGKIIGQDSASIQLELKRTSSGTDGNTSIKFVQPLGDGFLGVNSSGSLSFGTHPNLVVDNKFVVDRSGNATFAGNINFGDGHFIGDDGNDNLLLQGSSGESVILNSQVAINLRTNNGNDALTLDSSQNATFAGNVAISNQLTIAQDAASDRILFTRSGHDSFSLSLLGSAGLTITNVTDNRTDLQFSGSGNATFGGSVSTNTGSGQAILGSHLDLGDNQKVRFGAGDDIAIYHNGTDSIVENATGNINIINFSDDKDIIFQSDDGSGSIAEYFRIDGSLVMNRFFQHVQLDDNIELRLGTNQDLRLEHTGTNGTITNFTGNLTIQNTVDDADIIFKSDDGSGGTENYIQIDGSEGRTLFNKHVRLNDDVELQIGSSADLKIYHDGSNSYIQDVGTGSLIIEGTTSTQIKGSSFVILRSLAGENMLIANANGSVDLYHDGVKKFETTHAGVSVTGAGAFSGNVSIADNSYLAMGTDSGDAFNTNSAIRIQDTSDAHIQIKTATTGQAGILIGDTDDDYVGGFIYSNNTNTLTFKQNNVDALSISGSQNATFTGNVLLNGTNQIHFVAQSGESNTEPFRITRSSDKMFFTYGENAGDEAFYIESDGDVIFEEQVGIGTTSPAYPLHISLADGNFIAAQNKTNNVASTNVWGYGLYEGGSKLGEISLVRDGTNSQMYIGTTFANQILRIGSANKVTAITIDASQNTTFAGSVTAGSFIKSGGTSSQYLMADGSVSTSTSSFNGGTITGDLTMDNTGSGDRTLTISTTTGGDPTIIFNSDAANRSGLIKYQDNGTNIGRIEYVHNGDKLRFQAGSATGQILELTNSAASFAGSILLTNGSNTRGFATNGSGHLQISNAANSAGVLFLTDDSLTLGSAAGTGSHSLFAGAATFAGDILISKTDPKLTFLDSSSNTDPSGQIVFSEVSGFQNFDLNYNGTNDRLEFRGRVGANDNTDLVYINRNTTTPLNVLGGATFAGEVKGNYFKAISNIPSETSANTAYLDFASGNTRIVSKGPNGTTLGGFQILQQASDSSPASTAFSIDTNSNVGIGTTSPSGRLSVKGSGSTNSTNAFFVENSSGSFSMAVRDDGETVISGNVGIGTTSPSQLLTIGDSSGSSFIDINKSTSGENGIIFNNAGNRKCAIIQNSGEHLEFHTLNNNVRMIIQEGGNVGIGTTSPAAKLDVSGSSALFMTRTSSGLATYIENDGGYAAQYMYQIGGGAKIALHTNGNSYFNGGNVGIGTTSPAQKLHVEGALRVSSAGDRKIDFLRTGGNHFSIEHDTSQIYFYNHTTTESPILMQNDGDVIMNAGNVGIGTASPAKPLHVVGEVRFDNDLSLQPTRKLYLDGGNDTYITEVAANSIAFNTANGERMRISSDGNVGIGTSNFTAGGSGTQTNTATPTRLVFNNNFSSGFTDSSLKVYLFNDGATRHGFTSGPSFDLQYHSSGHSTNAQHSFYTNNNFVMRIGTGDTTNVGIGTTSPTTHINSSANFLRPDSNGKFLTLNGGANGSFIMLESSSTTDNDQIGGLYFTATGGQGDAHKQVAGIDAIVFAHNTTSLNGADLRFFTKPAGAGSTTPTLTLAHNDNATFAGSIDVASEIAIRGNENADDARIFFRASDQSNRFTIETDLDNSTTNDLLGFRGFSTDNILVLKGNGNVGIGTTSPNEKLVVGTTGGTQNIEISNNYIQSFNRSGSAGYQTLNFYGSSYTFHVGNVGIGVTSPSSSLTIATKASVGTIELLATNAATMKNKIIFSEAVLGDESFFIEHDGSGAGADNLLRIHGDGSGGTASGITIRRDGRVGIGTDSPDCRLDVRQGGTTAAHGDTDFIVGDSGAASSTAQAQILGGASGFSNLYFSDTAAYNVGGFIYNHSSNYLATNVSGSEKMRIRSDGNVGIGETNPLSKLTVRSDNQGGRGGEISIVNYAAGGSSGIGNEAALNFGLENSTYQADFGNAQIKAITTAANNKSDMVFSTWNGSAFGERMRIESSGNIGIGTSLPVASYDRTLHVKGVNPTIRIETNNSSGWAFHQFASPEGIWSAGIDDGEKYVITNHSSLGSGHVKFCLNTSGNVGIGVTSPSEKLEVNDGNIFINGENHGLIVDVTSKRVGFMKYHGHEAYISRVSGQDFGIVRTGGSDITDGSSLTTDLYVSSSGNIGIGTTSPSEKLEITGHLKLTNNGNFIKMVRNSGSAVINVMGFSSGTDTLEIKGGSTGGTAIKFKDTSSDIMVIHNSNVGIGNTSPSQKLHVTGSILASSDVVAFSDIKLKENIKTLDGSKVYDMRGVSFTRKDTGKNSSGVIAQEIQKIAPELVTDNDGTLSVAYGNLTGYLIEAVKELKAEIEELKKHKCDCKK